MAASGLSLAFGMLAQTAAGASEDTLAWMRRVFPKSPPWEAWLDQTGERPPDFERLPATGELPDPLRRDDGSRIRTRHDWARRRDELLRLFEHYVTGTLPPAPGNVRVAGRDITVGEGLTTEQVLLEFGPDHAACLHIDLLVPAGRGPFPVFITQDNHRRWAAIAASRGYLACVYAGADSRDDTAAWPPLWPEYDWTKLARRAWAASRCVDYLETRPDVDRRRIALTGHSRNGKTALIAAAFDPRFRAVISSSSGAGGACTWRLFSEAYFGEGIEMITRVFPDWLHPRLRFFAGRENRLPIDQHELIACIAPRACLLSTALNDNVESVWAIEQTRSAALPVFRLLGAPEALELRYRDGGHATRAEDIEAYLDWLDTTLKHRGAGVPGRRRPKPVGSPPLFPTYEDWLESSGERPDPQRFPSRRSDDLLAGPNGQPILTPADWETKRADILRRVAWALGQPPPLGRGEAGDYGAETRPVAALLGRDGVPTGLTKQSLNFGQYLAGDLYLPAALGQEDRRLPTFIWVHPISVSHGYVAGYYRSEQPHLTLARSGYLVFAFDQIGNGSRIREVAGFYRRYPRWSLLGKTVADIRAAVDALETHPQVDPQQIWLLGYGPGGMAALHAAALDQRVAGVVSVAGFTPLRSNTVDKGTGGVARWSRGLPLIPRLGAFVGREDRIPYDYHEVLAAIAPRPALIITPGVDTQSTFGDLRQTVADARRVFTLLAAPGSLVLQRTDDYNHFTPDLIWCLCGVETVR